MAFDLWRRDVLVDGGFPAWMWANLARLFPSTRYVQRNEDCIIIVTQNNTCAIHLLFLEYIFDYPIHV